MISFLNPVYEQGAEMEAKRASSLYDELDRERARRDQAEDLPGYVSSGYLDVAPSKDHS